MDSLLLLLSSGPVPALSTLVGPGSPLAGAIALLNAGNSSADAVEQRGHLIALVASSATSAVAPVEDATMASSATILAALCTDPSQMSASAQAAAVAALTALLAAGGPAAPPLPAAVASAIAGATSSVALAAIITAGGSGTSGAAAQGVLGSVVGLVNTIADRQANAFGTGNGPSPAPVLLTTAAFQLAVQQDNPGLPPSVTTASITAPGSAASFDPLPPSALAGVAGGAAVRTKFLSFGFDPHVPPAASAAVGRGGVTRLQLSTAAPASNGSRRLLQSADFAPLEVANLRHLITFSLPTPTTLRRGTNASGLMAVCSYFDEGLGVYSSAGCASQPSPLPAGVSFEWAANLTITSTLQLQRAWNFSSSSWATSPLLRNCTEVWIDCSNASQVSRAVFANPHAPFEPPGAVGCGGVLSQRLLRIYTGPHCALWSHTNSAGCWWNATSQACTTCCVQTRDASRFLSMTPFS